MPCTAELNAPPLIGHKEQGGVEDDPSLPSRCLLNDTASCILTNRKIRDVVDPGAYILLHSSGYGRDSKARGIRNLPGFL